MGPFLGFHVNFRECTVPEIREICCRDSCYDRNPIIDREW